MKPSTALGGGLAGACALTLIHETVKRVVPEPPRLDLLGESAISRGLKKAGVKVPGETELFTWALAGDLLSNALYYSLTGVGRPKNVWVRGALLGLTAGVNAVVLPKVLGLNGKHTNKTLSAQLMTVGLYVTGGLVATAVIKYLERREKKKYDAWEHRLLTSAMG